MLLFIFAYYLFSFNLSVNVSIFAGTHLVGVKSKLLCQWPRLGIEVFKYFIIDRIVTCARILGIYNLINAVIL